MPTLFRVGTQSGGDVSFDRCGPAITHRRGGHPMKKLMILVGVLVLITALTTSLASAAVAVGPAQQDSACARFNFLRWRDRDTGSPRAGGYEMRDSPPERGRPRG